jgi:hypothetical protein
MLANLIRVAKDMRDTHRIDKTFLRTLSQDTMKVHFRQEEVVTSTQACLEACVEAIHQWQPFSGEKPTVEPKVFLAGLMLTLDTNHVMVENRPESKALALAAEKIVTQLDAMMDILISPHIVMHDTKRTAFLECGINFCENLADLQAKFHAWKAINEPYLADRILKTISSLFVAMLAANGEGRLRTEDPQISAYHRHINRLCLKLRSCGGEPAVEAYRRLVKKVVEERRQLLLLREEQRRSAEGEGFDFIEN